MRLLPKQMLRHFAPMRPQPVFPHVDALPGSEHQSTVADRNRQQHRRQRGAHMRRDVVGPLIPVPE